MESVRVQRRRPRNKSDILTTGGQGDYYIEPNDLNKLIRLVSKCPKDKLRLLLLSLLTKKELADIVRRVLVAEMTLNGLTYEEIVNRMGSNKSTISLVKQSLANHEGILAQLLNPEFDIRDATEHRLIERLKRGK